MRQFLPATLLLLLTVGGPAHAQSTSLDSLLAEGARLYENNEFDAAREIYETALTTHGPSGVLLYNLGTVHYRLGRVGAAIQYLEKSAERMPDHPELRQNLRIVRQSISQPIPSMPVPFWQRWWQQLLNIVGARGLFLIGLSAYLPAVGLLGYRIWTGHLSSPLQKLTSTLTIIASVAMVGALLVSWHNNLDRRAVILQPEAQLYAEPATNSTVERTIPEGTVVQVNEDLPAWQRVELPNGADGWIQQSDTGDI
jgi:tetratricopeptide (TPR) repeat protein